jgi:hypothetical protein
MTAEREGQLTEESERMLLLLKELAVLKESEAQDAGAQPGGQLSSPDARRKRKKEIASEIKRIAQQKKNKDS